MQNIDVNESDLGQDQSLTSEKLVVSAGFSAETDKINLFRQNTYLQNKKHTFTCQVGLVVTDLITSPVVSWEGWETPPPPQHRGSAVILCSTTGVVRPLCSCGDLLLSSARHCLRLVDVDWNTFSLWMSIFLSFFFYI